jgi:ATP-dependent Clp protease ATP-binding subunit ClpC
MTSNLGAEEFTNKAAQIGFNLDEKEENKIIKDFEVIKKRIVGDLDEFFAPEFINRIDKILVFAPLDTKSLGKIIKIQLERLVERLRKVGVDLTYDTKVVTHIQKETYDPAYGARPVRRFIQEKIEDSLAELLLSKQKPATIAIHSTKNGLTFSPARP